MSPSAAISYYGKLKFRRLVFRSRAALHTAQPLARWASDGLETQTKDNPDMDSWTSVERVEDIIPALRGFAPEKPGAAPAVARVT